MKKKLNLAISDQNRLKSPNLVPAKIDSNKFFEFVNFYKLVFEI